MPRHTLTPISRAYQPHRDALAGGRTADGMDWNKLDRVQVLGSGRREDGHMGCVNALSWSEDGGILLSGSDDKRLCLWTPDTSPIAGTSAARSLHPMKLSTTIATGHHANIFSAKFLPNAGTPTIVSVAGDREIRLMEVERLAEDGRWSDLRGHSGPGVKVLKCHKDRTKKIATENSPFLFMTVSEDGPLFRAPAGVDLYSLSVSTVTPHIFAVAGRTDTAFVCDRRMVERQSPSWGSKIVGSGQVHCVRRLGLSNEEWDSVAPEGVGRRMFAGERHITCVKMSPEHADEAAVAFARHSTSLFSIHDSPGASSAHRSSAPVLPTARRRRCRFTPEDPTVTPIAPAREPKPIVIRSPPTLGKRRQSAVSHITNEPLPTSRARKKDAEEGMGDYGAGPGRSRSVKEDEGIPWSVSDDETEQLGVGDDLHGTAAEVDLIGPRLPTPPAHDPALQAVQAPQYRDPRLPGLIDDFVREQLERPTTPPPQPSTRPTRTEPEDTLAFEDNGVIARMQERDLQELLDAEEADFDNQDVEDIMAEYGPELLVPDDEDEMDLDVDEEDEYLEDEELDEDDMDDEDEDEGSIYPDRRSEDTEFGGVEMIQPRRIFKGAKNVETVKDCNFLGTRADKICSGSDDGHFFVWNKDTGKLDGIWEGDGSVVNVMEQHPTLPVVAVSGIDDTVKMFAPTSTPPDPSFSRLHLQDSIIKANTDRRRMHMGSTLNRATLLQFLVSQGMAVAPPGADDDDREGNLQGCQTQ